MRKVILQEWVTIDGFAADAKEETSFIDTRGSDKEADQDLLQFIDTIDTILLGATTYRMFVNYWPMATTETEIVADKLNATPKLVFSQTLERAPWGKWDEATVVSESAAETITHLKQQPGKDMVLWGSISLARSLIKEGVIDEYHLWQCPVLLGSGKSLFTTGLASVEMNLLDVKTYSTGLIFVRYAPTK